MAYQGINTGTTPNDGTGDTLVDGGVKINSNFTELYSLIGDGSTLAVGIVTIITAGTNVSINTSTGNVTVSAPTPVSIATTDVDISRNLKSAGITTLGVTTVTSFLTAGITTLASQGGVTTTGGDFYVGGDLYVLDDVVYDEVTGRNINITGIGTVGQLFVGSGHSAGTLDVAGVSTLTGNVSLGGSIFLTEDKAVDFKQGKFRIYHDDSTGNNIDISEGAFNLNADTQNFMSGAGTTQVMSTNVDGNYGVELYYNNTKRFETKHGGADVLGYFRATGISTLTGQVNLGDNLVGDGSSNISGISSVTATNYFGDGSNLTGIAVTANVSTNTLVVSGVSTLGVVTGATYYGDASEVADVRWSIGNDGSSNYTYTGIGFTQTTNDPSLYLLKGNVYEFEINTGGGHPFEIRETNGGSAYNDGVTNNAASSGIVRFEVPYNAPEKLYYQCTSHSGMGNTIYTVGRNSNISATSLVVTGVSTLGVVTGATYYGDGSNLTGIAVTANVSTDSLVVSGVSTLGVVTASNQYNTGIVTAIGGFVSAASTQAVKITFSGSTLTFNVAGIGSTSLTLS